jgi:hypothetical protein
MKRGTTAWQHVDKVKFTGSKNTSAGPITTSVTSNLAASVDVCATSSPSFPWAQDDCLTGYTSSPSVAKVGSINFKINSVAPTYSISFYRLGWYGGAGGTLVSATAAQSAIPQPACTMQAQTGLTECSWTDSYTLNVPATWTTGVYLAQLTGSTGWKNEILFVVRDDSRPADFLYEVPVLTYLAYNSYPGGSGKSLYDSNSAGSNTIVNSPRAVKVSLDRPQHHQFGSWLGSDWTEIHLVAWLEKMGYNINYTTDLDVHNSVSNLMAYKGILIGGHSEYWTKAMYDKTEQARDAGVNLAFFGANANHWQVRMENSSAGVSNRVLTCYKDENGSSYDPIKDVTQTKKWRDLGRAEQTLIGVQHDINGWNLGLANQQALKVQNTSHWAYSGSGLSDGSSVPYLVGYEIDNLNQAYPKPPLLSPSSQTMIAQSPYYNHSNVLYTAQASLYQAPSRAWVFGSGTMSWSWALGKTGSSTSGPFQNAGIQQVTKNMLDAFKSTTTPSNRAPIAVNDSVTVNQGASASIAVLANDSDPDGNSLAISSVGVPAHGTATNNGSSVNYTPVAGYTGADSFTYTISDGFGGVATATVSVTVNPVTTTNRAPTAVYDMVTVPSLSTNKVVTISPLKNDTDPDGNTLTLVSYTNPTRGTLTRSGNTLTFTASSSGQDSFRYTISDGFGGTATAPVWITIGK